MLVKSFVLQKLAPALVARLVNHHSLGIMVQLPMGVRLILGVELDAVFCCAKSAWVISIL